MLDPVLNFVKVIVSTGYDDSATSIELETDEGAKLPDPAVDGEFNLTWWDSWNYGDPADDPNVEIVRVTARSTDTLTVTRNQESSGASTKNTAGGVYKMILSFTKNTYDDLVSASSVMTDHTLIRGDGGAKGIQDSGITIDDSDNISGITDITVDNNVNLADTSGSTVGVIEKNSTRFIHNYEDSGSDGQNTFIGINSGNFTMAMSGQTYHASSNTSIGQDSLQSLTTGFQNTAIGLGALKEVTEGYDNTAIGKDALELVTTGDYNIGIGLDAGDLLTTGSQNTYIGSLADASAVDVTNETAIGYNVTGGGANTVTIGNSSVTNNYFSGDVALDSISSASGTSINVVLGDDAGDDFTVDTDKLVVEGDTGRVSIVGNYQMPNTTHADESGIIYKGATPFISDFNYGLNIAETITTAGNNTFVGINAGNLTMGSTATETYHGSYNTFIGYNAGHSNTTGYQNTANGYQSLYANTTGYNNTANGVFSLYSNTTGYYNTANGFQSLFSNTTGNRNIALGAFSLYSNTTGYSNTANGMYSLYYNTTGYNNTANGYASLFSNTAGSNNTALGYLAGRYQSDGTSGLQTPENSTYLGYNTKSGSDPAGGEDAIDNEIVIGYNAIGNGSNTVTLGNDSITTTNLKGAVVEEELSADPSDPAEGHNVKWQSDGTGSGSDGDIMMKITAGGVTKTVTIVDFSAL